MMDNGEYARQGRAERKDPIMGSGEYKRLREAKKKCQCEGISDNDGSSLLEKQEKRFKLPNQ